MSRLNVPNRQNVRFIDFSDFTGLFNLDENTKEDFNILMETIKDAHTSSSGLDNLYKLFSKETEYLTMLNRKYGVGWRLLTNLPF